MARIAGINLPTSKRVPIALTYIHGIGSGTAEKICLELKIPPLSKLNELDDLQLSSIREYISSNMMVEGDLRREKSMNIKRLMDIGSYRGIRHRTGLPLRGQRTKNNSRTRKGKRKTVANKKKVTKA